MNEDEIRQLKPINSNDVNQQNPEDELGNVLKIDKKLGSLCMRYKFWTVIHQGIKQVKSKTVPLFEILKQQKKVLLIRVIIFITFALY